MTDAEIIKALECCLVDNNDMAFAIDCHGCAFDFDGDGVCCENCSNGIAEAAISVINRQKAEIEKLEKESADKERAYTEEYLRRKEVQRDLKKEQDRAADLASIYSEMYSEATRDFAEKLKSEINELEAKSPNKAYQTAMEDMLTYYFPKIIDKCLKESVGDTEYDSK